MQVIKALIAHIEKPHDHPDIRHHSMDMTPALRQIANRTGADEHLAVTDKVEAPYGQQQPGPASALDSNRQIGIAISILTAQQRCTPDQAFNQLRAASQRLHRKLRDIAEHVTFTGELPNRP